MSEELSNSLCTICKKRLFCQFHLRYGHISECPDYIYDDPADHTGDGQKDQNAKADAGKPEVRLVPSQIVRDIAYIRSYGNAKYGDPDSWKNVETERYIDALYRHILSFIDDPYGLDEESGMPHLWHVATNCAFLCEQMKGKWETPK